MPARVSVIVRARDEEPAIGRCLELLATQTLDTGRPEVIVVDSGSRDRTVAIAAGSGAQVVEIAPSQFTFGRALNLGAASAAGEVLVALSAHAFPPDPGWLGRLVEALGDERVACASGEGYRPDGAPLEGRLLQDRDLAAAEPRYGFSNAAGAFRAELWRRRPFREDLTGCEDKEWAWHWLERGYACVLGRDLLVEHDHTHDPLPRIYERARREALGLAEFAPLPPARPAELAREWWSDTRWYSSRWRARFSHRRAARLLGDYAGRREAARLRDPGPAAPSPSGRGQ